MALNLDAALKISANVVGENNIRRLGNSLQGLEGQVKNASLATNLLYSSLKGLAAVAVTGGVVALAKGAIDLADDLRDLSQRTGVGIETLGQFKVAAELSGSSIETVAKSLNILNKNLVGAATGGKDIAAAFKTINVATTDSEGKLRTADKVFLDVANRFAGLRDGPEKAALAMKIFGKAGAELIPILNLGSKEIQRFGLGIGPDFADKADAFNDQLGLMKAQATVLTVQIGSALLPVLSGLVRIVADGIGFVGRLAVEFYKAIGGAAGLQQATAFLIKTLVVLGGVTASVFLVTNISTFANVLKGIVGLFNIMLLRERALLALETARASVLGIIAALQTPGEARTKAITALVAGTVGTVALVAGVGKLIDDLTKRIGTGLQGTFKMPEIPKAAAGEIPDISKLQTTTAPKLQKEKDISKELYKLELDLIGAKRIENKTLEAQIEYAIAGQKFDEIKVKQRKDTLALAQAEEVLLGKIGDQASAVGSAIAQDLIKQIDLTEKRDKIIADLAIRSGLITPDQERQLKIKQDLKQLEAELGDYYIQNEATIRAQVEAANGLTEAQKQNKEVVDGIANSIGSGLGNAFDALINGTQSWGASLREIAGGVLQDIAKQLFQIYVVNSLVQGIQSIFTPASSGTIPTSVNAAKGMVAANGIQPFAMGGIVTSPTLFKFANGGAIRTGQMGEAGPEAIMPLKRGADGKLGVSGGGGTSVVVNVDASGSKVEGNSNQAKQLGQAMSAAVQAELIKQKRPGGLLA